jgi:hypothetical protein
MGSCKFPPTWIIQSTVITPPLFNLPASPGRRTKRDRFAMLIDVVQQCRKFATGIMKVFQRVMKCHANTEQRSLVPWSPRPWYTLHRKSGHETLMGSGWTTACNTKWQSYSRIHASAADEATIRKQSLSIRRPRTSAPSSSWPYKAQIKLDIAYGSWLSKQI